MLPSFSSHRHLHGEHRLCRKEAKESGLRGVAESVQRFGERSYEKIRRFVFPEIETQENLGNPVQLLAAFRIPKVFTDTTPHQKSNPKTWLDVLKSMGPSERSRRFAIFAREVIPKKTRDTYKGRFKNVFKQKDVLTAQQIPEGSLQVNTSDPGFQILLDVMALIMGAKKVLTSEGRGDMAREAFNEIYPPEAPGELYADYAQEIEILEKKGKLEPGDRTNRIALIEKMRTCTFRGWLIASGETADPVLVALAAMEDTRDRKLDLVKASAVVEWTKMDPRETLEAERQGRTLTENYRRLGTTNPLLQLAVTGIGAWIMWRMAFPKDKNPGRFRKFVSIIPYGVLGYFAYQILLRGKTPGQTADDMGKFTQDTVNKTMDGAEDLFASVGGKGKKDRAMLDIERMVHFLEKNRVADDISRSSLGLAAISDMTLKAVALAYNPSQAANPYGEFLYNPTKAPTSRTEPFRTQLAGIVKNRKFNGGEIDKYFSGNSGTVARALSGFFLSIAITEAATPESLADFRELEKARRQKFGPFATYEDVIKGNKQLSNKYFRLVQHGHEHALGQGKNIKVIDIVLKQLQGPALLPEEPQLDTAQPVEFHGLNDKSTRSALAADAPRKAEFDLYDRHKEKIPSSAGNLFDLEKEKSETLKLATEDFRSFLAFCKDSRRNFIDAGAERLLQDIAQNVVSKGGSLQEKLLALDQMKYLVLVTAFHQTLPLKDTDIQKVTWPDPGTVTTNYARIALNCINDFLRTTNARIDFSGSFNDIKEMAGVEALVNAWVNKNIKGMPLNKKLPNLQAKLRKYKGHFRRLVDPVLVTPALMDMPAVQNKKVTGGAQQQLRAILELEPPEKTTSYKERIQQMEEHFAIKAAQAIVLASLTDHRSDHQHVLTEEQDERCISPIEEQNLCDELDAIFQKVCGPANPAQGLFGRLHGIESAEKVLNDTISFSVANNDDAERGLHLSGEIVRSYLLLQKIPEHGGVDALLKELKGRLVQIAEKIELKLLEYNAIANLKNDYPALSSDNLRLMLSMMELLDVGNVNRPTKPAAKKTGEAKMQDTYREFIRML